MSLVSVVIPNHNYAKFVSIAVEGALAQTHREIEIIVVDNGSTDDSVAVLKKFGSRIRLVEQENRGQSGARNRGIIESRGDFVAFCDADDAWLPSKVEKQLALFDRPEVGLVYTGHSLTDIQLDPRSHVRPAHRGKLLKLFADGAAAVIPAGESCVMIRRECFAAVGLFDDSFSISAGFDLYRRICQRYEVEVVSEPLVLYRQHGGNASNRTDAYADDFLRAMNKMFLDPGAEELLPLKRRCFGRAHVSLSGAYLHGHQWKKSLSHLARGLSLAPTELGYVLAAPLRGLRRMLSA